MGWDIDAKEKAYQRLANEIYKPQMRAAGEGEELLLLSGGGLGEVQVSAVAELAVAAGRAAAATAALFRLVGAEQDDKSRDKSGGEDQDDG